MVTKISADFLHSPRNTHYKRLLNFLWFILAEITSFFIISFFNFSLILFLILFLLVINSPIGYFLFINLINFRYKKGLKLGISIFQFLYCYIHIINFTLQFQNRPVGEILQKNLSFNTKNVVLETDDGKRLENKEFYISIFF